MAHIYKIIQMAKVELVSLKNLQSLSIQNKTERAEIIQKPWQFW